MPPLSLVPVEEMVARLERVLAGSPADATELVWIEARRSRETNGKRDGLGGNEEALERTVMVRVREAGRIGLHRTGLTALSDLEKAVREALAQARLSSPAPAARLPEGAGDALPAIPGLYDPEIPRLTTARARELIQKTAERGEVARLGWGEGHVAVVNSRGLRRAAEVTAAWLDVSCGQTPGAGSAAAVARSLAGLDGPAVFARARRRHAQGSPDSPEAASLDGPLPVALAPEVVAAFLRLLSLHALSSVSFLDGFSFLLERTGQQVFHPSITLRDDPLAGGAPFPFDFLGSARRRLGLVERGVFLGPARGERLAHALNLPPTPNLVTPDEAQAAHLTLQPGEDSDAELLRRAEGGLWINQLDALEAFDRRALRFRAVARGVRRIENGALGAAVPDFVWEGCLPDLLARVLGIGNEPVSVPAGDPLLGAVTAPLLVLTPRS
jgi:predicted Zn-dependent protease